MSILQAQQYFEAMKVAIDKTCLERDLSYVNQYAIDCGYNVNNVSSSFTYSLQYDLIFTDGLQVSLNYRSFDPSGPFQNIPDISRFDLKLINNSQTISSYRNEFEEKF